MKLMNALAEMCRENLTQEKILLVSSHTAGRNMIKNLAGKAPVLNLRTATIQGLAEELTGSYIRLNKLEFIRDGASMQIMFGILFRMQHNHELEYFRDIEMTPSISASIWRAVMELKHAGIHPEELEEKHFISPSKGRDMKNIMIQYALLLKQQGTIDSPDLLELAIRVEGKQQTPVFVPDDLRLCSLERRFLREKFSTIKILTHQKLEGLSVPSSYYGADCPVSDNAEACTGSDSTDACIDTGAGDSHGEPIYQNSKGPPSPFTSLYAQENVNLGQHNNSMEGHADNLKAKPHYDHIHLVKAYGETNEVRSVLRNIKKQDIPFDDVCVYVTTNEPYTSLLLQISEQLGIPMTFGNGINIRHTGPGQAVLSFIEWIRSDYPVMDLYHMLCLGLIRIPGQEGEIAGVTPKQAARLLRACGIGWGRERYAAKLAEQLERVQSQHGTSESKGGESQQSTSEPREEALRNISVSKGVENLTEAAKNDPSATASAASKQARRLQTIQAVIKFVESLFTVIPQQNNTLVSIRQLAKGFFEFVREFINVKNEFDAAAKEAIMEALSELFVHQDLIMDMDEALHLIQSVLETISAGTSGPRPGHLHLCNYQNGEYISRRHHTFLGLDAGRFPGRATEDPILLDVEKKNLSQHLPLSQNAAKENLYAFVQLLSGLEGEITFCYSAFDPVENREQPPSPLLLQVYRLICHDPSRDYSDLKKVLTHTEGYLTENGLDDNEFWLNRCYKHAKTANIQESVYRCHAHLKQGGIAWEQQLLGNFTCYDGYIGKTIAQKEAAVFSASRLELLAKCAYQYYVRHVLHVTPPEDIAFDPESWLDPLVKGTLYHSIFEQFYKALAEKAEKPEKPDRDKHRDLMLNIAEHQIQQVKDEIPPPNEIVFDMGKSEILESCMIFLAGEEEHSQEGTPEYFELGFGIQDEPGSPPVEIMLKSGRKLLLAGKIDRVDRLADNSYRIVDYKSGGTYGYRDRDFFKGGRQIQHALYALACETLLGTFSTKAAVKEGVYLFPTRKGEGRRFIRTQKGSEILFELLEDLLSIIDEGVYAATIEPDDCRWCEYKVICRIHRLHTVIGFKWEDTTVVGLSGVRRLKTYE